VVLATTTNLAPGSIVVPAEKLATVASLNDAESSSHFQPSSPTGALPWL
jgi:hypothetical protein